MRMLNPPPVPETPASYSKRGGTGEHIGGMGIPSHPPLPIRLEESLKPTGVYPPECFGDSTPEKSVSITTFFLIEK